MKLNFNTSTKCWELENPWTGAMVSISEPYADTAQTDFHSVYTVALEKLHEFAKYEIAIVESHNGELRLDIVKLREENDKLREEYEGLKAVIISAINKAKQSKTDKLVSKITKSAAFWPVCVGLSFVLSVCGFVYVHYTYGW